MKRYPLGNTGDSVSAIGLGCAGMSEGYGTPKDSESLLTLSAALAAGVNFLDTSDAYGIGHNEQLLGGFLQGRSKEAVLATKVGLVRNPGAPPSIDNSPQYIRTACDASLQRFRVETIDLYYLQRRDANVPLAEVIGAMADLVRAGKVRYLGLSEVSPETLRRACDIHPIAAVQSEYSLWSRDPESGMLATCRELGALFVAYCPLGRAFLTGEIKSLDELDPNDFRRHMPRFQPGVLEKNSVLLPALAAIAAERRATPAQIALAWLLTKHPHVVPIPGSKQLQHVINNAAAAHLVLSPSDIHELDRLFTPTAVVGARLPLPAMAGIEST
ncbi:MAG TPA: aldo/keto reductase [Steroidobacteraceae bacterium]|nr:aldo/keto reductase [Steroidobacteraceae bacterium]